MALGDSIEVDSGSYGPESIRLRRRLAESMLKSGMDISPVGHWAQGLSRVLQAMMGGYQIGEIERKEAEQDRSGQEALLGLLGASQTAEPQSQATEMPMAKTPSMGLPEAAAGDMAPYASAIASIESAGEANPYQALGPVTKSGDRAYGKYQVMGENIGPWTKEILGQEMTSQQFLASPQAQEAVFSGKFGQYLAKTGSPQDAASMWFTGKPQSRESGQRQDILGTSGNEYIKRFSEALPGSAPAQAPGFPRVDPQVRRQIGQLLSNPGTRPLGEALLTRMITQQPKVEEVEIKDQFGRTQKVPAIFNAQTRRYEPVPIGGQAAPQAQQQPELPAPGSPLPRFDQPAPVAPQAPSAPMLGGPGLRTQNIGEVGPSVLPQRQMSAQPVSGYREIPVNVNTLPKPAEGMTYDLGPNGLPLFDAQMNPKMIAKSESEERGKAAATQMTDQQRRERAAEGVSKIVSEIQGAEDKYGRQAVERALGPWQAPVAGEGTPGGMVSAALSFVPQMVARASGEMDALIDGGAKPTEVRDNIVQQLRAIATITKPFVRGQGEGAWSDADQRNLDELVGQAARSRSVEELRRRTQDTVKLFENAFGVKVPEAGQRARQADDPERAEDTMTWFERGPQRYLFQKYF